MAPEAARNIAEEAARNIAREAGRSMGREAGRSRGQVAVDQAVDRVAVGQVAARNIAEEAARSTRIEPRQAARSGDRRPIRIRRRAQRKAAGP